MEGSDFYQLVSLIKSRLVQHGCLLMPKIICAIEELCTTVDCQQVNPKRYVDRQQKEV